MCLRPENPVLIMSGVWYTSSSEPAKYEYKKSSYTDIYEVMQSLQK